MMLTIVSFFSVEVLKKLQQKHATFGLKKDFAQEERDVAVQTEEVKRVCIYIQIRVLLVSGSLS